MAFQDHFDDGVVTAPWTAYTPAGISEAGSLVVFVIFNSARYADETTPWTGNSIYRCIAHVVNNPFGCGLMTLYDGSHPSVYTGGMIDLFVLDAIGNVRLQVNEPSPVFWNGAAWVGPAPVNTGYVMPGGVHHLVEFDFSTSPGNYIITVYDTSFVPLIGPTTPRPTAALNWFGVPDGHISIGAGYKNGAPGQGNSLYEWFGQDFLFPGSPTTTTTTTSTTSSTASTISTTSSTASTISTTSTTSSTSTSTTTEPPRRHEGAYYYRFTQATANRLPDWMRGRLQRYSNIQQLLQPFGQESEEINTRMQRHLASMFLGTMDMDQMDLVYQISLPYSFEFEFDFTDPTNPRPKPPYTRGIIGTTEIVIDSVEENNIESFWYDPLPTRITIGDDEIELDIGDTGLLVTGDVLPATAIGAGIITATYTEPFVPGRLYVTIADGNKFGYKDNLVEAPAYVELKGVTVKDTEETERVLFYYNSTKITKKYWKEITEVSVFNTEPTTATLMITSVGATLQQIQDPAYIEYDTIGGRASYWELEESNGDVTLQHILPVSSIVTDEPRPGFQQDVHRTWILQDEDGISLTWADVKDYTLERFRPYIYVLMDDGTMHIYNKWAEYPDLQSIRFLKERTDSCNTWIDLNYDEGILDDELRLSAQVIAPTKSVAFYHLEGSRPSHDNDWYYIDTDGVWGVSLTDARVVVDPPTSELPYIGYTVDIDEVGVWAFKLTTKYTDGTEDVDVVLVWSRYKLPLATFDLTTIDTDLDDPLAICFDYNQTLWLGGEFNGNTEFKFKELQLHADLMLIDYDKKLLYLREEYEEVWVNDLTPPDPTGGTWIPIFTNAFWKDDVTYLGGHFTWTGTEWEQLSTPYTGQLVPASAIGWHTGYRPDYMRVTYSGPSTVRVRLKDEDGLSIADELSYSSGEIITLYWNATDLAELEFQWEDTGFTITDTTIEFYQVDTVTGTTTTTTSTTTTSSSTASTASTASTVSSSSTTTTHTCPGPLVDWFFGSDGDDLDLENWRETSNAPLNSFVEIRNNKCYMEMESGGFFTGKNPRTMLNPLVDGDFDIRVKYEIAESVDVDDWSIWLYATDEYGPSFSGSTGILRGYADLGGAWGSTPVAGHQYASRFSYPSTSYEGHVATTDTSGHLRITRVGTTWTTYHRASHGVAWVQNGQKTQGTPEPVEIWLYVDNSSPYPGAKVNFDDFCIAAGTMAPIAWIEHVGSGGAGPSNDRWTNGANMTWTGTDWDATGTPDPQLDVVGTWANGYRPTHMRVFFTGGGSFDLKLRDSVGNTIAWESNDYDYVSGKVFTIDFSEPNDIDYLVFEGADASLVVTSIEFGTF